MSGISVTNDLHEAASGELNQIPDPGNAGTIRVSKSPALVVLRSGGAETRTLAAPTAAGVLLTLNMTVDGGDIVVTAAATVNATGNNTITFAEVSDAITFISIYLTPTTYRWSVLEADGAALSTV